MEATTIDQLFPAVLEEIFSHLNASDVKNCALVCQEWDEVIGSAEMTMKKFELKFHLTYDSFPFLDGESIAERHGESQELELANDLQKRRSIRKHRNLSIQLLNDRPAKLPILEHFDLSQVKRFNACIDFNESFKTIVVPTLLSRMPQLQDLKISLFAANFDDADLPIVTLAKLKKLGVEENSTVGSIFKFIKAPNITDLIYDEGFWNDPQSDAKIDSTAAFIKDKKHLAKLTTTVNLFTQLFGRHDFSELRLESLTVFGEYTDYSDTAQLNLKKLLLSSADSLTSLQLPAQYISKEVFVAIFSGLRKLAMLCIGGDVNVSGSWIENLSINRTLKSLELTQMVMNDGLVKILQLAPHIESLSLFSANDSLLNQLATTNRRLVKLEIGQLMESVRDGLRFSELKSLKLDIIENVDFLASMLVSCPKIETFVFSAFDGVEVNTIVDLLLRQNTLKHLRMRSSPPNDCRFIFDLLKVNYGNLRSATIGGFLLRGNNVIQFDFPENPAEWNVEEQEARFEAYMQMEDFW